MNELDLMTRLRDEVPLAASPRITDAVMAAVAESGRPMPAARRRLARGSRVPLVARLLPRPALRPVLAGVLAVAVGAGAYAVVEVSGSPAASHGAILRTAAWSGRPTASWPSDAHPSYGRAGTEAQLIAYVTRAAESAPGRAPKSDEWVAVKYEAAGSSGGEGGYLFGPADKREISLQWFRGDGCATATIPPVPASLGAGKTVTGKLTIDQGNYSGLGCGATLGGWKSVSYSYLSSLPISPAALEDILAQSNGPVFAASRGQAVFESIYELLDAGESQGVVIPPKLFAALYRVLQRLPGVQFESATDLAGRTGLGFSMVLEGYFKQTLVVDPDTYTYLGFKDVVIKDHAMTATDGTRYVKTGHVMGWGALLGSAIVERPGQLPS